MITIYGRFHIADSSLLRLLFTSSDSGKGVMGDSGLIDLLDSDMPVLSLWRSGVDVRSMTSRKGV